MINQRQLLVPYRFRFTDDADIKLYGDEWFVYHEAEIVRLPSRTLVAYEMATGLPLPDIMNGIRANSVLGNLAASWVALRLAGKDVAWADYSPLITFTVWEEVPEEEREGLGKADSRADIPGDSIVLNTSPPAE
jgi:hypothetical protein